MNGSQIIFGLGVSSAIVLAAFALIMFLGKN
jgi:hypothetical protein